MKLNCGYKLSDLVKLMLKKLKRIYKKEFFEPSLLSLFVNPFHFARLGLHRGIKNFAPYMVGNLLDVGCGLKPYQTLFDVDQYAGLEIDTPENRAKGVANFYYDGVEFPFEVEQFDSVLCNQVFEHVFNPDNFIAEISRVLKPSGKLLLSVPFVWDEHEQPNDYARYSSFALKYILQKNGFRVIGQIKTCADLTCIFQLINAYLYKIFMNRSMAVQMVLTATVIAFFNITGSIFGRAFPKNSDLYLDNVLLAEKIS